MAVKWLKITADDSFPRHPLFENDANLNSLREDGRLVAFMAKLKQPWERCTAVMAAHVRAELEES